MLYLSSVKMPLIRKRAHIFIGIDTTLIYEIRESDGSESNYCCLYTVFFLDGITNTKG